MTRSTSFAQDRLPSYHLYVGISPWWHSLSLMLGFLSYSLEWQGARPTASRPIAELPSVPNGNFRHRMEGNAGLTSNACSLLPCSHCTQSATIISLYTIDCISAGGTDAMMSLPAPVSRPHYGEPQRTAVAPAAAANSRAQHTSVPQQSAGGLAHS